ncbi:hypothetical protein J7J12_01735 [bacterium]|nr:hypothetical protein [bacterium]
MRRNILCVFLCYSLFWGGMCWILFSLKIGVVIGVIAGILGVFYYSIIVVSVHRNSTEYPKKEKN